MQVSETVTIETPEAACDGGKGALGHPRVYLTVGGPRHDVYCPYCSRRFVLKDGAKAAAH
ncbi:MAG: zinc-finger domain-containing protein [Alphaproteobacteria bacterium]|nr:zinc-finger domain-containing protein [Alphaproteobacteria bacterium]